MAVFKAAVRGINLAQASTIIDVALADARKRNLRPMAIAVLDGGGDLIAYKREDHIGIRRYDIAYGKAFGALVMNRSSRAVTETARTNTFFVQSAMAATGGHMILSPGGILVMNAEGLIIGAVGCSGDAAELDETIAIIGINAAGLIAEPSEPGTPMQ